MHLPVVTRSNVELDGHIPCKGTGLVTVCGEDLVKSTSKPQTGNGWDFLAGVGRAFASVADAINRTGPCGSDPAQCNNWGEKYDKAAEKAGADPSASTYGVGSFLGEVAAAVRGAKKAVPPAGIARISGSLQGALKLKDRATELQNLRKFNGGTVTAIKVQNMKTNQTQVWVATEGPGRRPAEWGSPGGADDALNKGEVFIRGKGHAEQTVMNNLGDDWKIVQGGTNRNVCITHPTGQCAPNLGKLGITVDGPKFPWRPGPNSTKTDYRTFWWAG